MDPASSTPGQATSPTLLVCLRARDAEAWRRLSELYGPIVYGWIRSQGVGEQDAADLVQEVFLSVHQSIERFRKEQPNDSFRSWLWTITRRRIQDHFRKQAKTPAAVGGSEANAQFQEIPEPMSEDDAEAPSTTEGQVFRCALELIRGEFEQRTWQACMLTAVESRTTSEAAAELVMSLGAVYLARSRVLKRLREELEGLL